MSYSKRNRHSDLENSEYYISFQFGVFAKMPVHSIPYQSNRSALLTKSTTHRYIHICEYTHRVTINLAK